ncbi:FAD-binding protein [uncultured Mailhella sp.]|uniref:FAD-binding protein n=1 Tax=uncultured Mailhella sp. TaxID=1981031 RepID=UPI0025EB5E18|nr:FAD-binding protein [uncultured Mailhella sp.]
MDALNIVAIPGQTTAELYLEAVRAMTAGVVDAGPSYVMAERSYALLKEMESWGVTFPKDENGQYKTLKYHVKGKFQTAMDEPELKAMLVKRALDLGARPVNRVMALRLLTDHGRVAGAVGMNVRTGQMVVCRAKTVLVASGGVSRFTLPNSEYLYGVYDYPGNTGDGFVMALRAGAGVTGMEYTQRTMLIKDTNMPLLAICVSRGGRVLDCEGNILMEGEVTNTNVMNEAFTSGRGPVHIQLSHLPEERIREIEHVLFTTERPVNERFFAGRHIDFRKQDIELWPTEYYLCGGHGLAGIRVNERAETAVPGLYAAGDVASVAKQHLTGAFVFGEVAAEQAVKYIAEAPDTAINENDVAAVKAELDERFSARNRDIDVHDLERKVRRMVADYLVSPKNAHKFELWQYWSKTFRDDIKHVAIHNGHELSKLYEVENILLCADCSALAGDFRKESRWGESHFRSDYPERDDANWKCHVVIKMKDGQLNAEKVRVSELNEEVSL